MNMESVIVPILTFLLGAVVTAFAYTFALSNRVTKLDGRVDTISAKIETHITSAGGCSFHAGVAADAAVAKAKADEQERRLRDLEEKV